MPPLDVSSQKDLEASLAHWAKSLAAERRAVTRADRASNLARRRAQQAASMVDRRRLQLSRLHKESPRHRALLSALADVGATEHPSGSNWGPKPSMFLHTFHSGPNPWCGAFVGFHATKAGAHVTDRILFTPYIWEDARRHKNGLDGVVWKDRFQPGHNVAHTFDLVLFDFGSGRIKHVGALRAPWDGRGPLLTVEGNTSFGAGSQDNGGAVARRERNASEVFAIVSIRWPS